MLSFCLFTSQGKVLGWVQDLAQIPLHPLFVGLLPISTLLGGAKVGKDSCALSLREVHIFLGTTTHFYRCLIQAHPWVMSLNDMQELFLQQYRLFSILNETFFNFSNSYSSHCLHSKQKIVLQNFNAMFFLQQSYNFSQTSAC